MKYFTVILISLMIVALDLHSQSNDTLRKTHYGIELSQFITGSGFASGTEMYVTIIPDQRKSLSFGVYFCPEQKKIAGVTMHHEVALVRYPSQKRAVPYAFYNMIYRFTRTRVALPGKEDEWSYGLYKSLEHHLGIGVNINIAKNLHIKSALGYGVYFGSIRKPSAADRATPATARRPPPRRATSSPAAPSDGPR